MVNTHNYEHSKYRSTVQLVIIASSRDTLHYNKQAYCVLQAVVISTQEIYQTTRPDFKNTTERPSKLLVNQLTSRAITRTRHTHTRWRATCESTRDINQFSQKAAHVKNFNQQQERRVLPISELNDRIQDTLSRSLSLADRTRTTRDNLEQLYHPLQKQESKINLFIFQT